MRTSSSHWPILDQKLSEWVKGHIDAGYPITKSTLIRPISDSTESNSTESPPIDSQSIGQVAEPGLNQEIGALYNQAIKRLGNEDIIPLDEFLDPSDESDAPDHPEDKYIYIDAEGTESPDPDEEYIPGPPPELPSNSDVLGYLHDILLWVGKKEKGTEQHIRQIEGLISEFRRIQIDEMRQMTLDEFLIRK
jgi:hypothetical protein